MKYRFPKGGGFKTTVVGFLFMFDFSTFPRRAGKIAQKSESRKIRRWENRSLEGFDLD
jgi:hypothetical protein